MDDNDLKKIFGQFDPDLSDSDRFMERMIRDINAVDRVKKYCDNTKRRDRRSMILSATAGFVTGIIFTYFYPSVCGIISTAISYVTHTVPSDSVTATVAGIFAAAASLATAFAAYNSIARNTRM